MVTFQGFEKHVKFEHNQWAYVFLFLHLEETSPTDYTAIEAYISKQVHQFMRVKTHIDKT